PACVHHGRPGDDPPPLSHAGAWRADPDPTAAQKGVAPPTSSAANPALVILGPVPRIPCRKGHGRVWHPPLPSRPTQRSSSSGLSRGTRAGKGTERHATLHFHRATPPSVILAPTLRPPRATPEDLHQERALSGTAPSTNTVITRAGVPGTGPGMTAWGRQRTPIRKGHCEKSHPPLPPCGLAMRSPGQARG